MAKEKEPAKPTLKDVKEKKVKEKKVKSKKPVFKLVGSKDPKQYPFTEVIPKGYDIKVHALLKKRDYASDHLFYEFRAIEMENKAVAFRVLAEEAKKLGSAKDRGRAKRFVKLTEKMDELKQQLLAQGVDVAALLAAAAE